MKCDLHLHSCLSPCASLEMGPRSIVEQALQVDLDLIALTDHNAAFNVPAFHTCCVDAGIHAFYGMELTTIEEVHMLCLFDDPVAAVDWGEEVYDRLPNISNDPERFGDQPIVDAEENIIGFAEKLLLNATDLSISDAVKEVHLLGGLAIPAHIDRSVFGLLAQLGFLPDEPFDAVELTAKAPPRLAGKYPILRDSDAHQLKRIGAVYNQLPLQEASISALRNILQ